jgi:hypothetical protein
MKSAESIVVKLKLTDQRGNPLRATRPSTPIASDLAVA